MYTCLSLQFTPVCNKFCNSFKVAHIQVASVKQIHCSEVKATQQKAEKWLPQIWRVFVELLKDILSHHTLHKIYQYWKLVCYKKSSVRQIHHTNTYYVFDNRCFLGWFFIWLLTFFCWLYVWHFSPLCVIWLPPLSLITARSKHGRMWHQTPTILI